MKAIDEVRTTDITLVTVGASLGSVLAKILVQNTIALGFAKSVTSPLRSGLSSRSDPGSSSGLDASRKVLNAIQHRNAVPITRNVTANHGAPRSNTESPAFAAADQTAVPMAMPHAARTPDRLDAAVLNRTVTIKLGPGAITMTDHAAAITAKPDSSMDYSPAR